MQQTGHVDSYYAATSNGQAVYPALSGAMTTDVCIIGGGFTGVNAGLELAQRGVKTIVLESVRIGFGASGRNGGQLINGYSRELDLIADRYGGQAGRAIGALAREGGDIIRGRLAQYNIQCDFRSGGILAAVNHAQFRGLAHRVKTWQAYGFEDGLELLDQNSLRQHIKSERYVGGLIDQYGGHLHPLNLVQGEATALTSLGGVIYEDSPALSVDFGDVVTIKTANGEVKAKTLLVCGNAYLQNILPALETQIMPVSSQVLATEPLGPLAERLLPTNMCVEDCNYIMDYFRRSADNRILYGGGVVYGGQDSVSLRARVLPLLHKTFPELKEARIDYAWSGNFALTLARFPQMGRLAPNVYFAHGDSGHGVTTTHLLARILAEAVIGDTKRFEIFANLPFSPFPGGQKFRVPLTVIGSWWYRFRDIMGL